MIIATIGVFSSAITYRLRPIASDCPRSSAPIPGYAPGVSMNVKIGKPNFSARRISRSAFRYPWTRHAEIARGALLRVAALLLADHHARLAVKTCQTADNSQVIR